ncbi:MAG: protein translocase subunit SecDF [Bacteroidales bacterium]|jgi:SecD/SecF fusion protein|nr:protein translocase subunit SecDF [Bacteroidales bacterium]
MQNKGAIRIVAIIFALVCLYQLSFTYFSKRVEGHAKEYATNAYAKNLAKKLANGDALREQELLDSISTARENYYLDSVSDKTAYNFLFMRSFTYRECKAREINLGLDLKGGMNVMMEVSTIDVVRNLATNPSDPNLTKLIDKATAIQKETGKNFILCFKEVIDKESATSKIDLSAFFRVKLKEKGINANSSNSDVLAAIDRECTDSYDRTFQVLSKRIDKFGVSQPTIRKLAATERILIELPGIKDPQRVSRLLEGTAQLEFWQGGSAAKVLPSLIEADKWLAQVNTGKDIDTVNVNDDLVNKETETSTANIAKNEIRKDTGIAATNPLFSKLKPNQGNMHSCVVGVAAVQDKEDVDLMLKKASKTLPSDVMFLWGAKPLKGTNQYELYVLNYTNKAKTALLDGDVISDAKDDFRQTGEPVVTMVMKDEAARKWAKVTGSNVGNPIAIVLDSVVYSAPVVNGEITGGRSEISGTFTIDETKDLANILKSGKLTAPATIVQESIVGPSLGAESIHSGMMSFIVAFLLVFAYMIFFYNMAGIAACIALLVNLFFLFGVLASIGAVLTLPGIAGIVLTMGMAIDANVIIYERIKEELLAGKNLVSAITDGYKAAYSAIIDGNVTTLITGIVLAYFGSGPVQGFAITLCIGILTSLFCGIFISRLVFEYMLSRKKFSQHITFYNRLTKNFLQNPKINFVGGHKTQYIITSVMVLIALSSIVFKGLDYGVDFAGGRTYVIRFDQDVNPMAIRESLQHQFTDAPEVKTFGPNYQVKVTTKYKVNEDSEAVKAEVIKKLHDGTKQFFKYKDITIKEFESTLKSPLGIISSEIVGPTMADDIKRSAVIAVVISLILIFIYIGLRFRKWQYGLAGLASLTFDALMTIGLFSLFSGILPFSLEVSQDFVAAVLTVIGYSINDTVIVFDRVRENVRLNPKHNFGKVMNNAMNQTLSRTFNTLGSTLLVLLIVFIFGGEVLRGFMFALLMGIASGAFSSLFVACPIAYSLITRTKKEKLKIENK